MEFGIKYYKLQVDEKTYLLIPKGMVEGSICANNFYYDESAKLNLLTTKSITKSCNYLVDNVKPVMELLEENQLSLGDTEFAKEFYFAEQKDYILVVSVAGDALIKNRIKINDLKNKTTQEIYDLINSQPAVILNNGSLSTLFGMDSIEKIKGELTRLQKGIEGFSMHNEKDNITKIVVKNGSIDSVETDTKIYIPDIHVKKDKSELNSEEKREEYLSNISLKGLESYINERVLGHENEVKRISTILMMNLSSSEVDGTESILIPGPTGVGKTATFEVASEYLSLPYLMLNTPNLVPGGYKGETLETNLLSLYINNQEDMDAISRAIVVLDEFDKLEKMDLELKSAVKQILLKFIEGGTFTIEQLRGDVSINTRMFSKIFLGSFSDLFQPKRQIGIGINRDQEEIEQIDAKTIYNSNYFSKELISRIPHIITYGSLDKDTKMKIILCSKLSTFLKKKERLMREFGISTIGENEFAEGIIEKLTAEDKSMRDINNLINTSLLEVEHEILCNPKKYKTLVLSRDTVEDNNKFQLS